MSWTEDQYNQARPDRTPTKPPLDWFAVSMIVMPLLAWMVLR